MDTAAKLMIAGVLIIGAIVAGISGLRWENQRHPPHPPQASQVGQLLASSDMLTANGLRQNTFRVPSTVEDVRRFYHEELPKRGWRYCGTQATPGCTNLRQLSDRPSHVDVYRRVGDRDATGATVEIVASWNAGQQHTIVTVVETSFRQ